jgi:RNA polymerase sigma factor (sigma-70 family)
MAASSLSHFQNSFAQYTQTLASSKYAPLTAEVERSLVLQYASGSEEAFHRLVNAHLRFIVYSLRDYKIPPTVDIMDVVQEANEGFMAGLRRFDLAYRCRVFTFCIYWVKYYVSRMLKKRQVEASATDYATGDYDPLATLPTEDFLQVRAREQLVHEIVAHIFPLLKPRERAIMNWFYGLSPPYAPKTLQEIGSMLHMQIERVRQLKVIALTKCKRILHDPQNDLIGYLKD